MSRILITPRSLTRSPEPALQELEAAGYELVFSRAGETPDETQLLSLVPGCVGWLAGVEPISERVLKAAGSLRAISRNGTGADNIPMEAARARGITILRAEGANARGVAELAIGLILASLRHVPESSAQLKSGNWHRRTGFEIEGRTLGVIGCGAVGRLVVQLGTALGARVLAYDPYPTSGFQPGGDFAYASLPDLLTASEIVTLHCPMPADGKPVLDAAAIASMPKGVRIVNTARASLVDEAAILTGLEWNTIDVYATDVFAVEPPPPSKLLGHPRVIATPHIGGLTAESVSRATRVAVSNLRRALADASE